MTHMFDEFDAVTAPTVLTTDSLAKLFGISAAGSGANNTDVAVVTSRVRVVKLFASGWDAQRTDALYEQVQAAKSYVLNLFAYGLQPDDVSRDVSALWPELGVSRVRIAGGGTVGLVECD